MGRGDGRPVDRIGPLQMSEFSQQRVVPPRDTARRPAGSNAHAHTH